MRGVRCETIRVSEDRLKFLAYIEKLAAFYIQNNWDDNRERVIGALRNSLVIIIAKYKNEIIGAGRTIGDGFRFVQIVDLLVKESFRNQGIGEEIVRRLAEYYLKKKCLFIDVATDPQNLEAIHFYQKCGFIEGESTLLTLKTLKG